MVVPPHVKEYGLVPTNTKIRSFEANWNAAIDIRVQVTINSASGLLLYLNRESVQR